MQLKSKQEMPAMCKDESSQYMSTNVVQEEDSPERPDEGSDNDKN